jgi:hypothetical protein
MIERFPIEISTADKYEPAMAISEQSAADEYFERCVEHAMEAYGLPREEAEAIERRSLGYFAGYYDCSVRERVERLFRCEHPIFGSIAKNGPPSGLEAFVKGIVLGIRARRS